MFRFFKSPIANKNSLKNHPQTPSKYSFNSPKKKPRSENSGRGILEIDHIEN